jgi:hypothetical protein
MAGPVAKILTKSTVDTGAILKMIRTKSDIMEGSDFWMSGRAFIVSFGEEYKGELIAYEGLGDWLHWMPADIICFSAMSNQEIDHEIMGALCLEFAASLDGVVDFCGSIDEYTKDPKFLHGNDAFCYDGSHMMKRKAFEEWLRHPDFRMVK